MTASTPSTPEEKEAAGRARHNQQLQSRRQQEEEDVQYLRSVLQGQPVHPLQETEGRRLLSIVMKGKMTTLGLKAVIAHPDLPEDLLRKIAGRSDYLDWEIAKRLLGHPNRSIELEILVAGQLGYSGKLHEALHKEGYFTLTPDETRAAGVASYLWGPGDQDQFVALLRRVLRGGPAVPEIFTKLIEDHGTSPWGTPLMEKRKKLRELVGISEFI